MYGRENEPGRGYGNRRRYEAGYRQAHDNRYRQERRKPSRFQKRGPSAHQTLKEMMPNIRKLLELSVDHNSRHIDAQTRWVDAEERSAAGLESIARILNHLFLSTVSTTEE